MNLPRPRGPLSEAVVARLRDGAQLPQSYEPPADVLTDDDFHLALWVLYELHYRGFDDATADDDPEWAVDLLALRGQLERDFEAALRDAAADRIAPAVAKAGDDPGAVVDRVLAVCDGLDGDPALASYVHREATVEQVTELVVARSIYHLKESDPQSFVIARLTPAPKAALVELQYDEYGDGRPDRVHQTLWARGMEAMGLDASYAAHLDRVPGALLAENNAMSLLGLHRRLAGASMGHLAAFEATSSVPCRFYAMGVRRLELPEELAHYFDEHVEADAVHEHVALRDICERMVQGDPTVADDVVLGAAVCMLTAVNSGRALLDAWADGRSALRSGDMEVAA